MANAVEIHNLCKNYSGFMLENINFHIPEGICCGFIGANGAGKTTLLKAMTGMINIDCGEISLLGSSNHDVSIKEEIGILFDQPYFQEDWTPLDIEKSLRPFYHKWNSATYQKYLSQFELNPKKKFKNFSRGMKVKLAMAVLLSYNAKLLLMDEPTSGLDPAAREEMLDIMREYMIEEGRTILFSTHITSDLEHIADYIIYISHGSIIFFGEKEDFTSSYCIVRGRELPKEKKAFAIGLYEHNGGYECLMALSHIGGLPPDAITEKAGIDDIMVYTERNMKYA